MQLILLKIFLRQQLPKNIFLREKEFPNRSFLECLLLTFVFHIIHRKNDKNLTFKKFGMQGFTSILVRQNWPI